MKPSLNVTGAVRVDLRHDQDDVVEYRMKLAADAPAGARIEFIVQPGQYPSLYGAHYLREYGQHLGPITVRSEAPATVTAWIRALRGEDVA